ncbi:hypothetical protein [uncultured Cohaesibacter sp.]|uniref:hypothetical protein n=1 Tax=uncultured Cohaesibacter sp. TaxID=1002546 RepID=UPI00293003B9|nr:hypothetical protein [uncultured Cohaesibacter sp.]
MSCRIGTTQRDDPFLFRNHYPLPVRVMVGLFGVVLWLLPYALLIAPQWNHFSWLLVPYGLLGLAGAAAGSSFLLSASLGEARETRLDLDNQQLIQTARDWLMRRRKTVTAFADISILEMHQPHWATEETVLTIHPVLENGDSLPAFGSFPSRQEADKIRILMGHRPEGASEEMQTWTGVELSALKKSIKAQEKIRELQGEEGQGRPSPQDKTPLRRLH